MQITLMRASCGTCSFLLVPLRDQHLAVPLATVKHTKTGTGYGYLSGFPTTWFLKWGTAVDVEDHLGRLHLDGV